MIVKLCKGGTIQLSRMEEDEDGNNVDRKDDLQPGDTVLPYLSDMVILEEGFKFCDFLTVLDNHKELILLNPFMYEYMEIFHNAIDGVDYHSKLNYNVASENYRSIDVYKVTDVRFSDYDVDINPNWNEQKEEDAEYIGNMKVYNSENLFTKTQRDERKISTESYIHASLLGEKEDYMYTGDPEQDKETLESYAFTGVNIKDILDLPIHFVKGYFTFDRDTVDNESESRFEHFSTDKEDSSDCNLFDFLDCIITEICFHGGPDDTQKFVEELRDMKDEIDTERKKDDDNKNNDENDNNEGEI